MQFNESTQLAIEDIYNPEHQIFISDLGPKVTLLFLVRNYGPSRIFNATLNIHWPFGYETPDRPNETNFFLYPTKYESDKIVCDSTYFNLEELEESRSETRTGMKRTRSIYPTKRDIMSLQRVRRETSSSKKEVLNTDISCVEYNEFCVTIKCTMGENHLRIHMCSLLLLVCLKLLLL